MISNSIKQTELAQTLSDQNDATSSLRTLTEAVLLANKKGNEKALRKLLKKEGLFILRQFTMLLEESSEATLDLALK